MYYVTATRFGPLQNHHQADKYKTF